MMTSDYQFHRPLDRQFSRWEREVAATRRKAAIRKAFVVAGANLAGAGLLVWLMS